MLHFLQRESPELRKVALCNVERCLLSQLEEPAGGNTTNYSAMGQTCHCAWKSIMMARYSYKCVHMHSTHTEAIIYTPVHMYDTNPKGKKILF